MTALRRLAALAALATIAAAAPAAAVTYTSQTDFEAALDGTFTLFDLESATFTTFGDGWRLDDAGPAAEITALGLDSIGYNAAVRNNQDHQTPPTGNDWLISNGVNIGGSGQGGHIAFNFLTAVNGVGARSNLLGDGDGGFIRYYSGENLTGFLGEVPFGVPAGSSFGGVTGADLIRSVQFTCTVNSDLRCGVYDIQFGTFAPDPPGIPEPGAWALMISGFAAVGAALRRRRVVTV